MFLTLAAAGVTIAVMLGIIGIPIIDSCAPDTRGLVACLRDMADRKFDLPGEAHDKAAEIAPAAAPVVLPIEPSARAVPSSAPVQQPPPKGQSPFGTSQDAPPSPSWGGTKGGVSPTPAIETSAAPPSQPEARPAPISSAPSRQWDVADIDPLDLERPTADLPPASMPAPIAEPVLPESMTGQGGPLLPAVPLAQPALPPSGLPREEPAIAPAQPPIAQSVPTPEVEPDRVDTAYSPAVAPPPMDRPALPPVPAVPAATPEPAIASAEPVPPVPEAVSAAPIVLAPSIDAIELDGGASYVSGSGTAGALMRLYADDKLIGESPVEAGRWLVEAGELLTTPRRELRIEAIDPTTGRLLGEAGITVEITQPDPPTDEPAGEPLDSGDASSPALAPPVAQPPEPVSVSTSVPASVPVAAATPPATAPSALAAPAVAPPEQADAVDAGSDLAGQLSSPIPAAKIVDPSPDTEPARTPPAEPPSPLLADKPPTAPPVADDGAASPTPAIVDAPPRPEPGQPIAEQPSPSATPPLPVVSHAPELPVPTTPPSADVAPSPTQDAAADPIAVAEPVPTAEPVPPAMPRLPPLDPRPEASPKRAPLPPIAAIVPTGESASVSILPGPVDTPAAPDAIGEITPEPSTIDLPNPTGPALVAAFDLPAPNGQPVSVIRLIPFGDPVDGRFTGGKAIIRHGDTLWSIAHRYYGAGIHYRTIFKANRDLIHRPSRIFPGQVFDLPLVTEE